MHARTKYLVIGAIIAVVVIGGLIGTYYYYEKKQETITLLFEKDPMLFNPYGVILVNPERYPEIKFDAAAEFTKWLISSDGQSAIAQYRKYGVALFTPNFNESALPQSEIDFWSNVTVGSAPEQTITLATTTSTRDSGLLDYLLPRFYEDSKVRVDVVAVGTGAALEMGESGNADLVMVHARSLEDEFVANGYGVHRVDLMYNDFVVVGPTSDPAGINQTDSVVQAFISIYNAKATFVSRGDNSGTNVKELTIWNATGLDFRPDDEDWLTQNPWYVETGQGMGNTLTITLEKLGYTITDRATWLTFYQNNIDIQ